MKKILLIAILAVASLVAYAQPRAIGVNLGPWSSFSYQHGLGEANMLDVAANVFLPIQSPHIGVGGHVTYDWIDPFNAPVPWNEQGEWHWYLGVGGAGGYGWNANTYVAGVGNVGNAWNWGYLGAAGRIGIEYDFWFPLQLSLDWRPTLGAGLFDDQNGGAEAGLYWEMSCISLGVRYKF